MRSPLGPLLAGALSLACLGAGALPAEAAWRPEDVAALAREGFRVRNLQPREGGAVEAVFFVAAPPEVARAVLWDHERFPAFMPHTVSCRTLEAQGATRLVEQVGGQGPFRFRLVSRRVLTPDRITWHRVRGDLRENEGEWRFEAAPGGTVVTYRAHVVPDGMVPALVVGYLQQQGLPAMVRAVRERIEREAVTRPGR